MKPDFLNLKYTVATAALLAASVSSPAMADDEAPKYFGEVVRLDAADPEADLQSMLDAGALMLGRRQDLALMLLPYSYDDGDDSAASMTGPARRVTGRARGGLRRVPRVSPVPTMDVAIPLTGANHVAKGTRLPAPYTGAGVVTGFCDLGFDSRHINFTDQATGECRIARVVRYVESEGDRKSVV